MHKAKTSVLHYLVELYKELSKCFVATLPLFTPLRFWFMSSKSKLSLFAVN